MLDHQIHLYSAAASKAIDADAVQTTAQGGLGIESFELMNRAAQYALVCLCQRWPDAQGFSLFCGKGNNAGDGYVMAAMAFQLGMHVQIFAVVDPQVLTADALRAYEHCVALGLAIEEPNAPIKYSIVVDALLGTGFSPPLRQEMVQAISRINAHKGDVLSLDLPSGVSADKGLAGETVNDSINANLTVSFITHKIGLHTGAAIAARGDLLVTDLGVPAHIFHRYPSIPWLKWSSSRLSTAGVSTHKSRQGHVLVVGGDVGMAGAVLMAAQAAFRAGAGLVTIATHAEHRAGILARLPEAMWVDPESEKFDLVAQGCDAAVLGPGLGRVPWGLVLLKRVLSLSCPKILDADALYWLAMEQEVKDLCAASSEPFFITPHSAEAARLLDCPVSGVESDRMAATGLLAKRYQCFGVLKGPGSVFFAGQERAICAQGNAGMATAGMGDVLSGIAGALVAEVAAKGENESAVLNHAFQSAVLWHSAAADLAAIELGQRSLMATDVISFLPKAGQSA
ncbi:MAG: NAD(P)H-hydrate dehydratase [Pseudomonadales bacterium]|jgi:NAD(P)H-hydrate epimerase|nr:NAD(P)H-hydrate dehydratase [Pseudomonadales bacterium]